MNPLKAAALNFDYELEDRHFTLFYGMGSPLSNMYNCTIKSDDGLSYSTSEAMYQSEKALYFEDYTRASAIRTSTTPFEARKLGQNIKGFDARVWNSVREDIMLKVLRSKFGQNSELKDYLLNHTKPWIAECNQRDSFWSCGLSLLSCDGFNTFKWCGKNVMGRLLEEVRYELE
jgi:ribA/ribD-fused uncharacterized protein